jgi:metallophosphoesterase superfamily enzyme
MATKKKKPVLVFSDVHSPFGVNGAIDFLVDTYKAEGCGSIVCAGDLHDHHALSFHTSEVDAMSATEEWIQARKFVAELCKAFPKGVLVPGNHDNIIKRKLKEVGIVNNVLLPDRELYGLSKGWQVKDLYHTVFQHDVLIEHGMGANGMYGCINMALAKRCSYVMGHQHSYAMVAYRENYKNKIFGMNVGCLLNDSSYAARYGAYNKFKGVLGCGVVYDAECASFIPMR